MLFSEALEELAEGKYVQRPGWKMSGEYIVLMPGMQYIWKILTQPNPNAGNWMPLMADMLADDYEMVESLQMDEESVPVPNCSL